MIANPSLPHNRNRNRNRNRNPPAPHRRNPITRLPSSIREQVNQLIDDDKPFPEIVQWLATSGHPAITESDLTAYAEGPFQRWIRDHERMDRFAAQQDLASQLTKDENLHNFNTAAVTIAQLNLFDLLNRFDITTLTKRIQEKPELWFQLISAFCSFSRLQLARDKFEWQKKQAEARQCAREAKQRAHTPIVITADTLRSVRTLLRPSPAPESIPLDEPIISESTSPMDSPVVAMEMPVSLSHRQRHSLRCLSSRRTGILPVLPAHRASTRNLKPDDILISSPS